MRNISYSKHLFASPLLFLVCMILLFQGCKGRTADLPLKITICEGTQPIAGLVYVAYQEKFFEQQGLEVVLEPHSTGKACLGAVLDGKADLATVAETPIVLAGLEDKKFFVTATIHESEENTVVVARKDRGVVAPADLTGKKVGVTRGTNAQ
jgi:ABC-type nitrate/sulfonate/bicarbonate transport system substrate-binding protein